jgi:hypothetical protein
MGRADEIRSAIAQAIDQFGLYRAYREVHAVNSERARECAVSIFDMLDKRRYLKPGVATQRESIISFITVPLGHTSPGPWARAVCPTPPETKTIADAVYSDLLHGNIIV